jgi:hypothetical protein
MPLYLVIHSPRPEAEDEVRQPTRLRELADASASPSALPRWLKAWSPDLRDDRLFTLWEANSANQIRAALKEYGFLDNMEATPLQVKEWGPDEVRAAG